VSPLRRPDRVTRAPLVKAVARPVEAADRALNRSARRLAALALPFYRRYPYAGPLGLFTVDMRGAYSPEDGFFFNRVPKAANSTVMATLAAYSEYRKPLARRRTKSRFLRPAWMRAAEVAALGTGAVFRFAFVRDPYGRVLSAFADKVLRKRRQARRFYDWLGGVPAAAPDFLDFLRYLEAGGATHDAHWAPQTDLMLLPLGEFDFIGRLESLERDLGHVVERVFATGAPLRMTRSGPRTDSGARLGELWTPEARAIVGRVYAADFAAFGYPLRPG
jgi:hypothetical protein